MSTLAWGAWTIICLACGAVVGWKLRNSFARKASSEVADRIRREIQECEDEIHDDVVPAPLQKPVF